MSLKIPTRPPSWKPFHITLAELFAALSFEWEIKTLGND